ncbi:GntR family transcriptional regulator [Orrella sp. NBD-18]|uniref:GntR family transcriptional regulator n=1 Tax=Sheuella amnicola TaxID=2707330 RepID=A0A6B2QY88_9BURK|nr:GntR family transcriptional regulator [Sheuella amnicola]NDY82991.1 GntR family transcriptional regulator [Sheuella amnicola]
MTVMDRIPSLKLDRYRQSAPQVFEALRGLIISLELAPGTVLPRAELAEHYGLSQTPIRDALMRLADDGLVEIYPQHATVVSRIDITSALEVHFLRRSIEVEILKACCVLPESEHAGLIQKLKAHIVEQRSSLDPLDYSRFSKADQAFHREMYQAARVNRLWDLVCQQSGQIDRLRRLNLPAEGKTHAIVRDHEAILHALEIKDQHAAEAALRKHLSGTLSFVKEIRTLYPDWINEASSE